MIDDVSTHYVPLLHVFSVFYILAVQERILMLLFVYLYVYLFIYLFMYSGSTDITEGNGEKNRKDKEIKGQLYSEVRSRCTQ